MALYLSGVLCIAWRCAGGDDWPAVGHGPAHIPQDCPAERPSETENVPVLSTAGPPALTPRQGFIHPIPLYTASPAFLART